jgi:hypothetical protein
MGRSQVLGRSVGEPVHLVARQKIGAASADDFSLSFVLIDSLELPPSNLLKATRKPDVLVLSEIHG